MSNRKKRDQASQGTSELDESELEQVQGGALGTTTTTSTSLRKKTTVMSKVRTVSGKKLDFDGSDAVP